MLPARCPGPRAERLGICGRKDSVCLAHTYQDTVPCVNSTGTVNKTPMVKIHEYPQSLARPNVLVCASAAIRPHGGDRLATACEL